MERRKLEDLGISTFVGITIFIMSLNILGNPKPDFRQAVKKYNEDMCYLTKFSTENYLNLDRKTLKAIDNYLINVKGIVASRYNVKIDENGKPIGWIFEDK